MKHLFAFAAAGLFVAASAAPVTAAPIVDNFNGQTIQVQYLFPDSSTVFNGNSFNVVVGPGFELNNFPVGDPRTNVDISANSILFTYNSASTWTATSFNGVHFFDLNNTVTDILSVSINPATNMTGLNAARITFDNDNIFVNWNGLSFTNNTIVQLDVTFRPVPEPATMAVFGLMGLSALGIRRRLKATA